MPLVRHPQFATVVQEVSDKDVKSWTEAGWQEVPKKDEAAARERAARPLS